MVRRVHITLSHHNAQDSKYSTIIRLDEQNTEGEGETGADNWSEELIESFLSTLRTNSNFC